MRWLFQRSIWHPDAIDPDEHKFRSLKRIWLPFYDLLLIGAGVWAAFFGSPILHSLFQADVIAGLGTLLAACAAVCLIGVTFPTMWRWELAGKIVLVGLLLAYAASVVMFRTNPNPSSGFVAFIVVAALPLPIFRLTLLGEEIKEREDEV